MGKKAGMKRNKPSRKFWLLLAAGAAVIATAVIAVVLLLPGKEDQPKATEPTGNTQIKVELSDTKAIELGQGLRISKIGKYAGIFMEDGSDDPVSGIMMVILENTAEKDLQLARFSLKYSDFTAEFEATNLPAGQSVVLLERNRHSIVGEAPVSSDLSIVVFFEEKMSLMEEQLRLSTSEGLITIENISGDDISGDIYVYYKNSATDLLYGGITYRVKFSGGLDAGEKSQVLATHYDPDTCTILQITAGG